MLWGAFSKRLRVLERKTESTSGPLKCPHEFIITYNWAKIVRLVTNWVWTPLKCSNPYDSSNLPSSKWYNQTCPSFKWKQLVIIYLFQSFIMTVFLLLTYYWPTSLPMLILNKTSFKEIYFDFWLNIDRLKLLSSKRLS